MHHFFDQPLRVGPANVMAKALDSIFCSEVTANPKIAALLADFTFGAQ